MEDKFFLYDPNNGFETFATEDEQEQAAEDAIESYLNGDEWDEDVTSIVCGVITSKASQYGIERRPGEIDENGFGENGLYWPEGCEIRCNYEMEDIEET